MQTPKRPAPHWPSFRGPAASGVADGFPLPRTWDVDGKQNVLWKTPIPGLGHSSPVVWGDRVFVTSAVGGAGDAGLKVGLYGDIGPASDNGVQEWCVFCLDRRDGRLLWKQVAHRGAPKVQRHTKATHANATVATDGRHVLSFFGSEGLYCHDMGGKLLWKRDFGLLDSGYFQVPSAQWGFASSPVIAGDRVIVQCDVQKDSFVAALDLRTGRDLWRTPRADVPTWSTPQVTGGQVVVNGWKHIGGYDLASGKEIWRMTGGGDIPVPTPVVGAGLIFVTNAHGRMAPIYAIRPTATGDISLSGDATSNAGVAWSVGRGGAYMQTPLVYGPHLYVCRDNGVLTCYEAATGKQVYSERLGTGRTGFTASAVAGDGKLYYTGEEGDVFVVEAGARFQMIGGGSLGETCLSTPAIASGTLLFRTRGHVVAIGRRPA